ncbi:MAG: elongation factor Ts, partial [Methylococcales bacterium]|nr:elongation factor Ts [Methylococcales bacterium]
MECKKALVESTGDIEAAIEAMRKSGQAKAAKKAGRIAAEGLIVIQQDNKHAVMVEINSETDFVSKSDGFKGFCDAVAATVLRDCPSNLEALMAAPLVGSEKSVEKSRQDLISKIGENTNVRRFTLMKNQTGMGVYLHGTRIGVLVDMRGGTAELGKDIAMHIAASNPSYVSADQVDEDVIQKEKDIFTAQALESGKKPEIVEKMITGRIKKFLAEITLEGQAFIKDDKMTVAQLAKSKDNSTVRFTRFEVGEGIEKEEVDFAEEVRAQASA